MAGKRKTQQPEPAAETVDERWLRVLPKPPRPLAEQDETSIGMWMRRCLEVGGLGALMWLYRPENFPYDRVMRGRVQHTFGQFTREEDQAQKFKAEQAARQQADAAHDAAHEAKRKAGWAA